MKDNVIIIGSGLGGLECGYILARNGFRVTVLEQDKHIGGCLQAFRRRGSDGVTHTFDTGFHYVGGLAEGQCLYPLFSYLGLMDLPWIRLDDDCFDEVVFTGEQDSDGSDVRRFPFASGHERFAERLAERFPSQMGNLKKYTDFLKDVGDNIFRAFSTDSDMSSLFGRSAYGFLEDTISDPLLRDVLSGTSLKLELNRETLPLYEFAQINNSFIQSAWRLGSVVSEGPENATLSGGALIADRLASSIRAMGGTVRTGARVTSIKINEDGSAAGVNVRFSSVRPVPASGVTTSPESGADIEFLPADWIISDAHPAVTVNLIEECKAVRKIYRKRISGLKNTLGMFTANLILKPGTLPYQNRNIFVHRSGADLWVPGGSSTDSVMIHFYPTPDVSGSVPSSTGRPSTADETTCIDLLSPMSADWDETWADARPKHRGDDYEALKQKKLDECIDLADSGLRNLLGGRFLRECIDTAYTSSPLTWQSYTGIPGGSAYGIAKDWTNPMATVLSPHTPLPNLLMTGQSLNLHGILGVSMTSVLTSSCILGLDALTSEILA